MSNATIGAIAGDMIGSRFEWEPTKSRDFSLFTKDCKFTDGTVMTLAVAKAILDADKEIKLLGEAAVHNMQEIGRLYPTGDGDSFYRWIWDKNPKPYMSFENGAAVRISPCACAADSLEEAVAMSVVVTGVTHNHSSSYKAAEAVATAIYMGKTKCKHMDIIAEISNKYYPEIPKRTLAMMRPGYHFDVTCDGSVPQAIQCFAEAINFEDAIRNAISLGGDAETQGAIAGSIAGAYFGVPDVIRQAVLTRLDDRLTKILNEFINKYGKT